MHVIFDVLVVLDVNDNMHIIFDVLVVLDFNDNLLDVFDVLVVLVFERCPQKSAMILTYYKKNLSTTFVAVSQMNFILPLFRKRPFRTSGLICATS